MKRGIKMAGEALVGIEFIVYVLAATALVAVGPVIWLYRLLSAGNFLWAGLVAMMWIGSVVMVGREVRRKAITAFSLGIFLTWLVVLVYVFRSWFL